MKKYFLTSPSGIASYLRRTISGFGYFVRVNQSLASESFYLNINRGTRETPNAVHVRISNHPSSRYNTDIRYDYDICANHSRRGATTYIKFLAKFAAENNKPFPAGLQPLQPGTYWYKKYSIRMQKHAAL
ncbi:MAG: hypothetical protein FWB77_04670 [Treponema sp.]|nr:hypothetical protein [Treponema sp.]